MKKDNKNIFKKVIKAWTLIGMLITSGAISGIILASLDAIYENTEMLDWLLNETFTAMCVFITVPMIVLLVVLNVTKSLYKKYVTNS